MIKYRGKISSPPQNFRHFPPTFFSPIRYMFSTYPCIARIHKNINNYAEKLFLQLYFVLRITFFVRHIDLWFRMANSWHSLHQRFQWLNKNNTKSPHKYTLFLLQSKLRLILLWKDIIPVGPKKRNITTQQTLTLITKYIYKICHQFSGSGLSKEECLFVKITKHFVMIRSWTLWRARKFCKRSQPN